MHQPITDPLDEAEIRAEMRRHFREGGNTLLLRIIYELTTTCVIALDILKEENETKKS